MIDFFIGVSDGGFYRDLVLFNRESTWDDLHRLNRLES